MKNTAKINESTLRKIVAESVKKALSEIINPFDDGFGGVDTAMATSYSNKNIGDAWLKKAGMRRDMLQGGKPVPKQQEEENESKINESCSYKINESTLSRIITKSVKKVLKESDDFKPHGYKGTSNWGGYEMQISDGGDMARLRDSHTGKVSDWLEIQFDEDGVAYVIDANGNEERLCDYMRY